MELRYKCGHTLNSTIHKDGLEYINLRFVCNDCRKFVIRPQYITIKVGVFHTLVLKRAYVAER